MSCLVSISVPFSQEAKQVDEAIPSLTLLAKKWYWAQLVAAHPGGMVEGDGCWATSLATELTLPGCRQGSTPKHKAHLPSLTIGAIFTSK